MSEFTDNKKNRIDQLLEFFIGISKGKDAVKVVEDNLELINNTIPSDVVILVDRLIQLNIPIEELKKGINKFLNLLFRTIRDYPYTPPEKNSYFGCCLENNRQMDFHLKAIRPLIKKINKNPNNEKLRNELKNKFIDVEIFNKYYIIKENVLFPLLENNLSEYRCIQLMWSFHDDIRKNLKLVMKELNSDDFDLRKCTSVPPDFFTRGSPFCNARRHFQTELARRVDIVQSIYFLLLFQVGNERSHFFSRAVRRGVGLFLFFSGISPTASVFNSQGPFVKHKEQR